MKKRTKSILALKAGEPKEIKRVGLVSRLDLALALGKPVKTVDCWIRDGVCGFTLPVQFVGARIFIRWEDFAKWQEQIKAKRLGKPVRRKVDPAAMESLKRNGYIK